MQFHSALDRRPRQHKADKTAQRHFRLAQFGKAAADLDYTHDKEQYKQGVGDGFERVVDVHDSVPDTAAFEILRRGADENPDFRQFVIPGTKGTVQVIDDPLIVSRSITSYENGPEDAPAPSAFLCVSP